MNDSKRMLILNDKLVVYKEASISLASCAMKYGASVFEGIRGYWSSDKQKINIIFLNEHINRLLASAKLMQMKHQYNVLDIQEAIVKLVIANKIKEDCYIRCALSLAGEGNISCTEPVLLSIDVFPYGRKKYYNTGIKLSITSWKRINENAISPRIKCISNYQNARLALIEAQSVGYDDVIFLNDQGYIAEASTSNVFFIIDGKLITPRLVDDILDGITRKLILHLAKIVNIHVIERPILRTEAYLAEEAFLCGTGNEIQGINSIDGYQLCTSSDQSITKLIQQNYENFVRGNITELNKFIFDLNL